MINFNMVTFILKECHVLFLFVLHLEAKMFYTCGPNEAMVVSGRSRLFSIQHY